MSASSAYHATIRGLQRGDGRVAAHKKRPPLVGEVAGQFVFQSKLLFLESVEKVFVGMSPVLFLFDESVESSVLGLQFLDHCLVHWCRSFQVSVTALQ